MNETIALSSASTLKRAARFGLTGVFITLLHALVAVFIIRYFYGSPALANGVAFICATLVSYLINTYWSFSARMNRTTLLRFLTVSFFGFLLAMLVARIAEKLGLHYLEGIAAVACIIPVVTFVLHNFWTYRSDAYETLGSSESLLRIKWDLGFSRLGLLVSFLVFVQAGVYLSGYRLTADDVYFHNLVMDGWADSWQFIQNSAFHQGRVVQFVAAPFLLLGSYFADIWIFRLFYTALYFANFFLVGWYVALLSRLPIALFVVLVLISLHPLDFYHLPPNSYPLHLALPLFLILVSRIRLLKIRSGEVHGSKGAEIVWLGLCLLGMMFSEYGFVFGISLMFSEAVCRIARASSSLRETGEAALNDLKNPDFLKDALLSGFFLASYGIFRWFYPSTYSGNQVSEHFRPDLVLKTLFGHIYGGTAFAAYVRDYGLLPAFIRQLSPFYWVLLLVVLIGTFIAVYACFLHIGKSIKSELNQRLSLLIALGIIEAILVTLPLAVVDKYHDWCQNIHACLYLDSRMSFLGFGVAFTGLLILLVMFLAHSGHVWLKQGLLGFLSLLMAVLASFTFLNNLLMEERMKWYVSPWERAQRLACTSASAVWDTETAKLGKQRLLISHHTVTDLDRYWSSYIKNRQEHGVCDKY